jgi:superkiller protein 3
MAFLAIEIKPDYHEAYNTMGIAYIGLRKHQKAIDTFKKAIKIKPDYHDYNNMGVAYNGLGKYQEAIDSKHFPNCDEPHENQD